MRRYAPCVVFASIGFACLISSAAAGEWLQFRGPNAAGHAVGQGALPADIGPDRHVAWKTPLPPGHSSPAVTKDRIFLTAVRDGKLLTLGLDRDSGAVLWEVEAPYTKLEAIHRIGSHVQSSPVTDGQIVVSFFGSCGMFCYDRDGRPLWHQPMGPFKNDFGAGSSPIIVDNRIVLCQDHDTDSFLAAYDKATGNLLWRADRSEFTRNYCTPVIWTVKGKRQIVVAATLRVVGYDFDSGEELWTVRGIARFVGATPVIAEDGTLFAAGWGMGGDAGGEKIVIEPFEDYSVHDKNGNQSFEEEELPDGPVKMRFTQFDRDKNGSIDRQEYDYWRRLFTDGKNLVIAIAPGAAGEATESHLRWKYDRDVPFCASPVYDRGLLFTVKDGGIFSALDARTGKLLKKGRLSSAGDFYSSPVLGDGKLYITNEEGKLTVVSASGDWQTLHSAEFGENVYATPAIVDGAIYYRTAGALYCFRAPAP